MKKLIQTMHENMLLMKDIIEEQQHEINVLRRQIAEVRVDVFEKKSAVVIQMPKVEAALSAKEN